MNLEESPITSEVPLKIHHEPIECEEKGPSLDHGACLEEELSNITIEELEKMKFPMCQDDQPESFGFEHDFLDIETPSTERLPILHSDAPHINVHPRSAAEKEVSQPQIEEGKSKIDNYEVPAIPLYINNENKSTGDSTGETNSVTHEFEKVSFSGFQARLDAGKLSNSRYYIRHRDQALRNLKSVNIYYDRQLFDDFISRGQIALSSESGKDFREALEASFQAYKRTPDYLEHLKNYKEPCSDNLRKRIDNEIVIIDRKAQDSTDSKHVLRDVQLEFMQKLKKNHSLISIDVQNRYQPFKKLFPLTKEKLEDRITYWIESWCGKETVTKKRNTKKCENTAEDPSKEEKNDDTESYYRLRSRGTIKERWHRQKNDNLVDRIIKLSAQMAFLEYFESDEYAILAEDNNREFHFYNRKAYDLITTFYFPTVFEPVLTL